VDERERELERRFRASGASDDEAAWLRERLRAGRIPTERLRLAAVVGHPAACRALGCEPLVDPAALGAAVAGHGREALLRALLALARAALPAWEQRFPRDDRPRIALEAAQGEAGCPCPRHRAAVAGRLGAAADAWAAARQVPAQRAAQAALLCQRAAAVAARSPAGAEQDADDLRAAILAAGDLEPPARVRALLRAALAPWALGYPGP
jgi:hypothetical protein